MISSLGAATTFFLLLVDLVYVKNYGIVALEILALFVFFFCLLNARLWGEIRWLRKFMAIALYLLINIAIFIDASGFDFTNAVIFFIIFISLLILGKKGERPVIIGFTFLNVGALLVIENFFPQLWLNASEEIREPSYSIIFKVLLFVTGGMMIHFLKSRYESLSGELLSMNNESVNNNHVLEGKVEERTDELHRLYKELDLLFYRSSHDFRRPLTTLKGLNEVARLSRIGTEGMELMDLMSGTVNQMDQMLKKFYMLYEISRFQENGHRYSLRQVMDDLKSEVSGKGHQFEYSLKLIHYNDLDARNKILAIILENLAENAVHYAKGNRAEIRIDVHENHHKLNIIFEDYGIGIDETYFNRIFDMYFRGTELSQGNGLGLYVVKSGVEKLDGRINLKSEKGKFTLFEINMPIQ